MENNTNNGSFSFGEGPGAEPLNNGINGTEFAHKSSGFVNLNKEDTLKSNGINLDKDINREEPEIEVVEAEELTGSESKRVDDIFESMNNNSDNNRNHGSNSDRYGADNYKADDRTTCRFCGETVSKNRITCPRCGHPLKSFSFYTNIGGMRKKNKWISLILCALLGGIGAHKFYEGRIIMGIVYALTGGLFGVGVMIDFIALLLKTNPYYV